jgi:hypothetical protein
MDDRTEPTRPCPRCVLSDMIDGWGRCAGCPHPEAATAPHQSTDIVTRLRETLTGEDTDEAMWQRIVRERAEAADAAQKEMENAPGLCAHDPTDAEVREVLADIRRMTDLEASGLLTPLTKMIESLLAQRATGWRPTVETAGGQTPAQKPAQQLRSPR